ncbi:MAG TPA: cytochrome c, partial [Tepidisphaeraceae bacterium]|nr:cytochrome c [Tepidisphaeraceae bacterium]
RIDARLSQFIRGQPLLQFINPAEKVQQDVLQDVRTDVAFQKITTIDRCRTCHVNIDDEDFTQENILAFLEKKVADHEHRDLNLPGTAPAGATQPRATIDAPGAAALGEFWHAYAVRVSPAVVRRNAARIKTITDTVGKGVTVRADGKTLPTFAYDPALPDVAEDAAVEPQDKVLGELLKAWAKFEPKGDKKDAVAAVSESPDRGVRVEITNGAANAAAARSAALKYPEELRTAMEASLGKEERRMLLDRYRRALAAVVNARRRDIGQPVLDDGRVMLAHPRLDLYVGIDSKHSYERVGCTSCHDGSGQETDFVLTAHSPRDIWVDQKTGAPVLPEQLVHEATNGEDHGHHAGPTLASMLEAVYPHGVLAPIGASSLYLPGTDHGADGTHSGDGHTGAGNETSASSDGHGPRAAATPDQSGQVIMAAANAAPSSASGSASTPSAQQSHGSTPAQGQGAGRGKTTSAHDATPGADARPTAFVDPVTGQRGRAVPQIRYWAKKYELEAGTSFDTLHHRWDWPMRAPQYIEANCVRCHTQVTDIREDAPTLNEGRALFANMGCANCHQMDSIPATEKRQVGTDLRHVNDKLSPAFINTWVWAPKAFRPSTKMPHFFMLENNSSDEELRRTRQEARAITEYLVASATPMPQRTQVPPTGKGSADAGRLLFETVGCQGCHVNLNAPTKTAGVTVAQQWITQDLIKSG